MLGETIGGRYKLVRTIGEGGMGTIYEGVHTETERHVAVKVIRAALMGDEAIARFLREQRAAAALGDEHIAQVLDGGVDEATGTRFFAMELLEGEDVSQLLDRLGPLPADLALRVAAQACVGLEAAHGAGVIHRDIKPGNLFVARRGHGDLVVKLLDFGVAKTLGDTAATDLTTSGVVLGSARFMAPEQAQGSKRIDARTDVWSLGMVMYKVLTGRTPCDADATFGQILIATCSTPATPVRTYAPWVDAGVAAIVHRCLQIDPGKRYASAKEMREAILRVLPDAMTLHESMLVPLTDEVVASAATTQTPLAESIVHDAGPGSTSTRSRARRFGAGAALLGGTVALLVVMRVFAWRTSGFEVVAGPGPSASHPASSATAASSMAAALDPVPITRSVPLRIVPPSASVEIDGHGVTAEGGSVVLEGALGSAHVVKVSQGSRFMERRVAITESGALPDTLSLADLRGPAATRPPAAAASARAGGKLEIDKQFR